MLLGRSDRHEGIARPVQDPGRQGESLQHGAEAHLVGVREAAHGCAQPREAVAGSEVGQQPGRSVGRQHPERVQASVQHGVAEQLMLDDAHGAQEVEARDALGSAVGELEGHGAAEAPPQDVHPVQAARLEERNERRRGGEDPQVVGERPARAVARQVRHQHPQLRGQRLRDPPQVLAAPRAAVEEQDRRSTRGGCTLPPGQRRRRACIPDLRAGRARREAGLRTHGPGQVGGSQQGEEHQQQPASPPRASDPDAHVRARTRGSGRRARSGRPMAWAKRTASPDTCTLQRLRVAASSRSMQGENASGPSGPAARWKR